MSLFNLLLCDAICSWSWRSITTLWSAPPALDLGSDLNPASLGMHGFIRCFTSFSFLSSSSREGYFMVGGWVGWSIAGFTNMLWFHSQERHTSRLWVLSPLQHIQEQLIDVSLSQRCLSLSVCVSPFLSYSTQWIRNDISTYFGFIYSFWDIFFICGNFKLSPLFFCVYLLINFSL